MNKIPYIERDYIGGGLKGECAYVWALFLADEADMSGDVVAYDTWRTIADQLKPRAGVPTPSSVYYSELEDAITEWSRQ